MTRFDHITDENLVAELARRVRAQGTTDDLREQVITIAIDSLIDLIHTTAVGKGWWQCQTCKGNGCSPCGFTGRGRNIGESLALIHSEVSEALEAKRQPHLDAVCDKCGGDGRIGPSAAPVTCGKCGGNGKALAGSRFAEELADTIIRIMDLAGGEAVDLGSAIVAKMTYNAGRPHRHGKEF